MEIGEGGGEKWMESCEHSPSGQRRRRGRQRSVVGATRRSRRPGLREAGGVGGRERSALESSWTGRVTGTRAEF